MTIDDMPSRSDRPPGWETLPPLARSALGSLAWETNSMDPALKSGTQDASLEDLLDNETERRGDNNE